jgi:putative hydrolase of the HAD superfamily
MNKIENIIFDFGGVLYNISFERAAKAFENIGFIREQFQTDYQSVFLEFESGNLSRDEFVNKLQSLSNRLISKKDILWAFDQILIGIDQEKVADLRLLKKKYCLYLLSNTNEIHFEKYSEEIRRNKKTSDFYSLFQKEYYSHLLKMRKPDVSIFNYVIKDSNLDPIGTLFVDDNNENIAAASSIGFNTFLIENNNSWKELIKILNEKEK